MRVVRITANGEPDFRLRLPGNARGTGLAKDRGHSVCRDAAAAAAAEWDELGIHPVIGDLTDSISLPDLGPLDTVLFAVGYDRSSGRTIEEVYVHGLANALQALPDSVQRLIYISSTGVFGQSAGEWVDENSPCQPARAGGRACLAAERLLQSHPLAPRSVILRLAGLYGPGRVPKLADLRRGRPLAVPSSGFLNLIHVEDAARIVLAAEQRAVPPCCYVVADGQPVCGASSIRKPPGCSAPPLPSSMNPQPTRRPPSGPPPANACEPPASNRT